ncbi:uncharacterized protein CLUP02_00780 [Colletotrichum lupini]|uniref:Uncharacterized protein n=1 Tax=Colletotrichum lupini TaxID=145971 RepID=A0A9Q8SCR2_9PEZI|nr:uncharacterized protein CLUP02_00780 [Colletotrichum lupini]UQC74132.1 hypothetical protein CLUP02_00780 [Colletotrichum lupini]
MVAAAGGGDGSSPFMTVIGKRHDTHDRKRNAKKGRLGGFGHWRLRVRLILQLFSPGGGSGDVRRFSARCRYLYYECHGNEDYATMSDPKYLCMFSTYGVNDVVGVA